MAIKTGIGVGAAQIFDNRGTINAYMKLIQERKKEDAIYRTELADLISKINTKGINDADKPEVLKMYGDIKDLYGRSSSIKNRQERALLKSQISKSISDLNEYAANSADFIKRYDSLAKDMAKNPWAYDANKLQQFKKLKDLPLTQLGGMSSLDPFEYQRLPDMKSRDEVFGRVNRQGENFAKGFYKSAPGGREQYVKVLGDDKINELIDVNLQSNPEYKYLAIKNWSDANPGQPLDMNKVRANEVLVYKTQYNPEYVSKPERIPKEPKGDTIIIGGDATQPKTFYSEEQKVKDKSGKTVVKPSSKMVEFDAFIGVNPQQFSLPQLDKRLNITTGKWEPYRSSGNVEIVGVGRRSGSGAYNVIVQDKDGFEYMVTEQDLPVGIRNNKIYKAAKASVYSSRPSAPKPSTPPSPSPKPNKNIIPGKKDSRL